jgi:hypothetical protein
MQVPLRPSREVTDNPSKLARSLLKGWGLIDLPLRASNEGLLRPRVARAQKIIRLHPLLCSGSKGTCMSVVPLAAFFHPPTSLQGWGLVDLPLRASKEGLLRPRVARAQKIDQPLSHPLFCEQEGHLAAPHLSLGFSFGATNTSTLRRWSV